MFSCWTFLAIPKSVTLHVSLSPTNTLRAARSRWIIWKKQLTNQWNQHWRGIEFNSPIFTHLLDHWHIHINSSIIHWFIYQSINWPIFQLAQLAWFTSYFVQEFRYFNLQILMTSNSFHQQFAKQISSTVVTSDLFGAWYPGLWNKCHWVHGSFSGNPRDLHTGHTRSKPIKGLKNKSINLYT